MTDNLYMCTADFVALIVLATFNSFYYQQSMYTMQEGDKVEVTQRYTALFTAIDVQTFRPCRASSKACGAGAYYRKL